MDMRVCPGCKLPTAPEDWTGSSCKPCNAKRYNRYKSQNRDKELARKKAYRERNKEKISAYQKTYMKTYNEIYGSPRKRNPEYYKEVDVKRRGYQPTKTIERGLLAQKLAYWGGRCWICREAPHEHWDHVKPLSKGGLHLLSNLRPSCAKCNLSKRDKWPFEAPKK